MQTSQSRLSGGMACPGLLVDFKTPSSKRTLEALHEEPCRALLLKFALCCTGSEFDAEDLFSETRDCLCGEETGRPWDPTRGCLLTHARMVMRDLARQGRRSARARREVLDGRLAKDETTPDPHDPPDDALELTREIDRDRQRGAALRQHLRGLVLRVFDLRCQGYDDPAEIARVCACDVDKVYDANQSIAYHAGRVLAEERKAEAKRMKDLRSPPKKKLAWLRLLRRKDAA